MNLEDQLMYYKKTTQMKAKEEAIQETICRSKEIFFFREEEKMLSYHEFLWKQLQLIQKRWWVLQFSLLSIWGSMLLLEYEESYASRNMGILAALFVILIIPEFWKSRSCQCMEIEEASYYSLRQIYAARMVLFGIVDTVLLTLFCMIATFSLHMAISKLLVQFILPMLVTACICFGTLCSKQILNETIAVFFCILWSTLWSAVTYNEKIYAMITLPMWMLCFGVAMVCLGIAIYQTLNNCNQYWEGDINGIRIS